MADILKYQISNILESTNKNKEICHSLTTKGSLKKIGVQERHICIKREKGAPEAYCSINISI